MIKLYGKHIILLLVIFLWIVSVYRKKIYYTSSSGIIAKSFNQLKRKKNVVCYNYSKYLCIDYNNIIPNIYKFMTKKKNVQYKQESFAIINSNYYTYNFSKIKSKKTNIKKELFISIYGFKDVLLSFIGTIHSNCWDITINGGCRCSYFPKVIYNKNTYNIYDKVVSIAHNWGKAVFHSIVECLAKIGFCVNELLNDSSIKIHIIRSASINYLNLLGFNESRYVYGNIYVKRLLIIEKGRCGSIPSLFSLLSLRKILREKIKSKQIYDIIIIKRRRIRDIENFNDVYINLKNIYKDKKVIIFYPTTLFNNTVNYFKYAKLIVAPHGAGLSNIIVSLNCTIVEFLLKNLCYAGLAKNLGLKYYGIYERYVNNKFVINITRFNYIIKNIIYDI